jgi:GT2 family glycosyltransferase
VTKLGVVIEGLNEGERFRRCLESFAGAKCLLVYVDSGSTDGSLDVARLQGCTIVNLDVSTTPFNCARARNAGFTRLMELDPAIEFVQFIDADCEMAEGWLQYAIDAFEADTGLGIICGRLREKNRNVSIYGRLCDMEWDGPVGEIETCGGIAMMRSNVFRKISGFNVNLRGGEEFELCQRMKLAGYRIVRVVQEMGIHDAGMTTFGQWAGRNSKYAFVNAESIACGLGDSQNRRYVMRAIFWAGVMPSVASIGLVISFWYQQAIIVPIGLVLLYGILALRIYGKRRKHGNSVKDACLYSIFCIIGKWPELSGILKFWRKAFLGQER